MGEADKKLLVEELRAEILRMERCCEEAKKHLKQKQLECEEIFRVLHTDSQRLDYTAEKYDKDARLLNLFHEINARLSGARNAQSEVCMAIEEERKDVNRMLDQRTAEARRKIRNIEG